MADNTGEIAGRTTPDKMQKQAALLRSSQFQKTGLCCLSASMISMMINSVSHNAPRRLTTTAETDQLTRFCTFLRVARMECSRQGPVCKHQRKRRTSIKRGNGSPAEEPQPPPSPEKKHKEKKKKHKRPAAYLADLAEPGLPLRQVR